MTSVTKDEVGVPELKDLQLALEASGIPQDMQKYILGLDAQHRDNIAAAAATLVHRPFRFYLVDYAVLEVYATNNESLAEQYATDQYISVIDTRTNSQLIPGEESVQIKGV